MKNGNERMIERHTDITVNELRGLVAQGMITPATIVALGARWDGQKPLVEVQTLKDGIPVKLEDKLMLPVTRTVGHSYLGSLERTTRELRKSDAERSFWKMAGHMNLLHILRDGMSMKTAKGHETKDTYLVVPAGHEPIETRIGFAEEMYPVISTRGDITSVRFFGDTGAIALVGQKLLFAPTTDTGAIPVNVDAWREAYNLSGRGDFLGRIINKGGVLLVVVTMADRKYEVLDITNIASKSKVKSISKIDNPAQFKERFVGSPAGNGFSVYASIVTGADDSKALVLAPKMGKQAPAFAQTIAA